MVTIEAGSFTIGSGDTNDDEKSPPFLINIKKFKMGKYEVTRGQFAAFVKATNYDAGNSCRVYQDGSWSKKEGYNWRNPGFNQTDNDPVVCVSWDDAKAYVNWLNQVDGGGYRLPSEAEWEYACRGPDKQEYCGTNSENDLYKVAVYGKKQGLNTMPVGGKEKNGFGLNDMSGNVWEWVEDWYHDKYSDGIPRDGKAWESGGSKEYRVLRGGFWYYDANLSRAAYRASNSPGNRKGNYGFRVARTVP
jgi:formylglycine-generating enzyme required for sulfatase activity